MTRVHARVRRGVTLVELLVVMAIITALGALALMIAPGIANQDNTLKGTADVQASLKIAQGMAGAARQPRGVRLISPTAGAIVTELQYLESPPVLVPDPLVLVSKPAPGDTTGVNGPRVEFRYDTNANGAVTNRHCYIVGLNADQEPQVVDGSTLVLPLLNSFSRINTPITVIPATATPPAPRMLEVTLSVYPDAALGEGTSYRTYHFGLYGPARPLLGEPTIQLPKNIGVDLQLCSPAAMPLAGPPYQNYDIVFAPSGQRIATASVPGSSQVFLWVRDYTKVPSMLPTSFAPLTFNPQQFRQGGEQQIVAIRSAAVGTAPVLWPDLGTGQYSTAPPQDPFSLARQKLTGP
jgi:prepilin-type N-terminal cleavage/methylation domain-containing protein